MPSLRKLLFILNFFCFVVQAQHSSELGRFSIPYSKACAPVTVSVTSTDNFGDAARTYFYEEGLTETTDTFHTYTEPGIYKLVQFPALDVSPKTDTLVFEVLPPTPPEFSIFQCSDTEVQVEITDNIYDYYVIKFTNQDSVVYAPSDPPPTYDYGQGTGDVRVIGYYNDSYPNCGDTFQAFNISTPIEAGFLSEWISEGCQNQFFLNMEVQTDPLTKYQIEFQQGNTGYQQVYAGPIHQPQISYPVPFDTSEPSYCVRVNTLNPCTNTTITGESICNTIDIESFNPLAGAYATYQNDAVLIHINPTLGNEILLSRRSGVSVNYSLIASINQAYLDDVPSQFRPFDYKLAQQDTCGNKIDSVLLNAPFIKIRDKNRIENTITISSEEPNNNLGPFGKSIIIYNPDSSIIIELPYDALINLPAEVGNTQRIRTMYTYMDSGILLFSNEIVTSYETTIFVPTAFTPNGDGFNDHLVLFGLPTNEYEISIFNRWGELIHLAERINPVWDGRINDSPAPEGTYRYKLNFKLSDGEVKSQVGTFVLLKK